MEVIVRANPPQASVLGADYVEQLLTKKPKAVLGLATGRTPVRLYQELSRRPHLDFRQITTFNLDEYVGLPPEHPSSYHCFMQQNFFRPLEIQPHQWNIPDGQAADLEQECQEYEERIQASGGIDLQILGIGHDGHIGFNEPTSSLRSRTRVKTLTASTVEANRSEFPSGQEPPLHVLTMGVGTILEARQILLMAFGESKSEIVAKMIEGPLTAMVPASALQLHPKVTVILDEPAASRLTMLEYYRQVYDHKNER